MSSTALQPLPALWLAWNSTHTAIRFWTADPAVAAQQASTGLILTPFYSAGQQRKAWNEGYKHGAWQGQHCAPQPATDIDEAQLQRLHERGAVAWAGVDAADLRAGGDGLPLGNQRRPIPPASLVDRSTE